MKTIFSIFFLFMSLSVLAGTKYVPGAYKIDPSTELVINTNEGSMAQMDGYIDMQETFESSKVVLFDVNSDSKIKFVSTKISGNPESFKLKGDLTLNGVTKSVIFDTRYIGVVADGHGMNKAAFIGQTKIFRQNGEEIAVDLRLLASRPSKRTEDMYEAVYHMVK